MTHTHGIVLLRGGGDLATGVAHRLKRCGFAVGILEIEKPTVIRRTVSFANAIFEGNTCVEGITARLFSKMEHECLKDEQMIPIVVDEKGDSINSIKPDVVVDCILAKRNLGTKISMAPIVVGAGPGFTAGVDVHAVVETMRGHNLGRVFYQGRALDDTGIPEMVMGYGNERVVRACRDGQVKLVRDIGDCVEAGDIVCTVDGQPVYSTIKGVVRGMIHEGLQVIKGMKIGDVDPRGDVSYCHYISDKARSIGGGVLEAILTLKNQQLKGDGQC